MGAGRGGLACTEIVRTKKKRASEFTETTYQVYLS
jgi:hypothetical protein